MPAQTSMVHVRVDDALKAKATDTLSEVGLTLSDAVRILLTRVVAEGGLPPGLTSAPKAYDEWFTQKVRQAMADQRPKVDHADAMTAAQAIIDGKKRASD